MPAGLVRLELSGTATIGANGEAVVYLDLVPFAERWTVTSLSCRSTSALDTAFDIFRNTITTTQFLDGVDISGNNNTTDTVMTLEASDRLVCRWRNGTPGAICTVTASGEKVTR